jgi:hypothetical protein
VIERQTHPFWQRRSNSPRHPGRPIFGNMDSTTRCSRSRSSRRNACSLTKSGSPARLTPSAEGHYSGLRRLMRFPRIAAVVALSLGCGGGGGGAGGGGSLPGIGGFGEGPADASPATKKICDQTCAALVACGAGTLTCSTDCQTADATYVDCVRAAKTDCNGIATCILEAFCPGRGPSGAAKCATAARCEGTCNLENPTSACGCGCVASMAPSQALHLVINNECANYSSCPSCNPATFDGAECNVCAATCVAADECSKN